MTDAPRKPTGDIQELLAIMRRLRDPDGGCPWDLGKLGAIWRALGLPFGAAVALA